MKKCALLITCLFFALQWGSACGGSFYHPPTSCKENVDCPGLQQCKGNKCVPPDIEPECGKPEDCKLTEMCKDGKCVKDPDACKVGTTKSCYTHDPKYKDKGICKAGKQTCEKNARWSKCTGSVAPSGIDCKSDKDNNCNGKPDKTESECTDCKPGESRPCYTGPADTKGKGLCTEGKSTCGQDKKWSDCQSQILPKAELCSGGKDEDCDGQTDLQDDDCKNAPCSDTTACKDKKMFCVRATLSSSGFCLLPCKADGDCSGGKICKHVAPGQPKYCVLTSPKNGPCNIKEHLLCPHGQFCNAHAKKCADQKVGKLHQICDDFGNTCPSNLHCAYLPLTGVCVGKCSGSCPNGYTCVKDAEAGVSYCLRKCNTPTDCTKVMGNGYSCYATKKFGTQKLCLPKGLLSQWVPCVRGGKNCKPGLRCHIDQKFASKRPIGYCTPTCKTSSICAYQKDTSPRCLNYDGQQTCLLPCASKPSVCKMIPGFSCKKFSSAAYCSP